MAKRKTRQTTNEEEPPDKESSSDSSSEEEFVLNSRDNTKKRGPLKKRSPTKLTIRISNSKRRKTPRSTGLKNTRGSVTKVNQQKDGAKEGSEVESQGNVGQERFSEVFDNDEEIIKKKRDGFSQTNMFPSEMAVLYQLLNESFANLELHSQSTDKTKVSSHGLVKSSQHPIKLKATDFKYTDIMSQFCSHWLNVSDLDVIPDLRSTEIYTVPLKWLCYNDDRMFLFDMSNEKAMIRQVDGLIHLHRYYVSFCSSISHQKNKFVRDMLVSFLKRYFSDQATTLLTEDLANPHKSMNAIILFDRKQQAVPKMSNPNNFINIVVFSTEEKHAVIYIDYVATKAEFTRGSVATTMMNVAQHCAVMKFYNEKLISDYNDDVFTYINCVPVLSSLYLRYGFDLCDVHQMKDVNDNEHHVYQHFDAEPWYLPNASILDQHMVIMRIQGTIDRWMNYLPYDLRCVEDYLFQNTQPSDVQEATQGSGSNIDNEDPGSEKDSEPGKKIGTVADNLDGEQTQHSYASLKDTTQITLGVEYSVASEYNDMLNTISDNIKYCRLTERDITTYQTFETVPRYVAEIIRSDVGYVYIGQLYALAYEGYYDNKGMFPEEHTMLTKEAMRELCIRLIPCSSAFTNDNDESFGMWIELKCAKCKKSCYLRKRAGESLDNFLIQSIYSKWSTHLFGLAQEDNNEWNICNKGWNICKQRNRSYYHTLKNAIIFDSGKPLSQVSQRQSYFAQKDHLQVLCDQLFTHHTNIVKAIFAKAIDIRQHLGGRRACRSSNYTQRKQILARDIGATKTLCAKQKAPKQQSQADIERRHKKEKAWSKEYFRDLSIQLRFNKIRFVDPSTTNFQKMFKDSQDFVSYYSSEAYKKSKKKDPSIKPDLSHFIAITEDSKGKTRNGEGNDHVICEDYFVAKDSMGKKLRNNARRISVTTVNKCYKSPNRTFPLTILDKRLIKNHVQNTLAATRIQKVQMIHKKDFETETTLFEGKRHESRIRFQGMDTNQKIHLLSDDWLEINFKEKNLKFFNKLMTLKEANTWVEVPVGRRRSDESKWPLLKKDRGPCVKYVQKDENSCLFCSMASAFNILKKPLYAQKIMSVYIELSMNDDFVGTYTDILNILRNKYKLVGEMRIKVQVYKKNYKTINELLDDKSHDIIMIVLSNRHAVAFLDDYIIDPFFPNALPRNEKSLRVSSELLQYESSKGIIKRAYGFNVSK